jgi:hypothetical protein
VGPWNCKEQPITRFVPIVSACAPFIRAAAAQASRHAAQAVPQTRMDLRAGDELIPALLPCVYSSLSTWLQYVDDNAEYSAVKRARMVHIEETVINNQVAPAIDTSPW